MADPATHEHPSRTPCLTRADPPSAEATIAVYERLGKEYDRPEHATTRTLEQLSSDSFGEAAPLTAAPAPQPTILELGAGTGAMTRMLLGDHARGKLVITDPARAMCERLLALTRTVDDAEVVHCDALTALDSFGATADVVLGGLADPFLTRELLDRARSRMRPGTVLFVTTPTRSWALREREERLGIPLDRTRFRLGDGAELEALSSTYDELELGMLLLDSGLSPLRGGTRASELELHGARPEVAWALAVRPEQPTR